jgi:8-oxo-dGTP diphosphatase
VSLVDVAVAVAVIVHGDRVLLTRRRPGDSYAGKLEFPGGKVQRQESFADAVRREVYEETGLQLGGTCREVWQEVFPISDTRQLDIRFFLASYTEVASADVLYFESILQSGQGMEGQEMAWVKISSLQGSEFPDANAEFLSWFVENHQQLV